MRECLIIVRIAGLAREEISIWPYPVLCSWNIEESERKKKTDFTAKRLQIVPLEDTEHAKARLACWSKKKTVKEKHKKSKCKEIFFLSKKKKILGFNFDSPLVFWQFAFCGWSFWDFFTVAFIFLGLRFIGRNNVTMTENLKLMRNLNRF